MISVYKWIEDFVLEEDAKTFDRNLTNETFDKLITNELIFDFLARSKLPKKGLKLIFF